MRESLDTHDTLRHSYLKTNSKQGPPSTYCIRMADPSTTPIIGVAADPLTISSSNTTALAQLLLFGNKLYPFLPTYAHLLVAALLPIYAGAHASLARPNNVRPIEKKKRNAEKKPAPSSDESGDGEEEEEEEEAQPVENLTAKDAMLFPVTAGLMLGLLYVIIKYLKDPTLLSRILTYYFIIMGAAAVGTFCADGLGVVVNVVFPRKWRGRNTGGGLYVAGHNQYHYHDKAIKGTVVPEKEQANPFPRSFIPVPKSLYKPIWALRRKLLAKWAVVIKLGTGPASKTNVIRKTFWVGDLVGLACGVGCVLGYVFTGKHWVASNLMGVSFAYSAMRVGCIAYFVLAAFRVLMDMDL